jgi:hypothetical protein
MPQWLHTVSHYSIENKFKVSATYIITPGRLIESTNEQSKGSDPSVLLPHQLI